MNLTKLLFKLPKDIEEITCFVILLQILQYFTLFPWCTWYTRVRIISYVDLRWDLPRHYSLSEVLRCWEAQGLLGRYEKHGQAINDPLFDQ